MSERWLIVGLGNPGRRYKDTWHNLGYMAVDRLATKYEQKIKKSRFLGKTAEAVIAGKHVLFLKPTTFMNRSGMSVRAASDFFRIPPERILVIADDIDLTFGQIRLRGRGSAGSHNGLRDIQAALGQEYARLRLGMGPRPEGDLVGVVLERIPKEKEKPLTDMLQRAADCAETFLREGLEAAQQVYN